MRLSRRTLLRSAKGLVVGLPLFESLTARAQAAPPQRFVALYHPNGVYPQSWYPTVAPDGTLSLGPSHAALEPYKSQLLYLSGLDIQAAVSGPGEQHQRGLGSLLTGRTILAGSFVGNDGTTAGWGAGISLDQELVNVLGSGARAGSLQLGVHCAERDVSGCLSYAGPAMPLLPENDPQAVYNALFSNTGTSDQLAALRERRKSVLDTVLTELGLVEKRLAASERARLDAHLTLVRQIETQLDQMTPLNCAVPGAPPAIDSGAVPSMPQVAQLQLDLLAVALSCDLTRVATLCMSDAKDHIPMPFINIGSDVHNISHLADAEPTRAQLGTRDAWVAQQLAYLMSKLAAQQESGGTVLDHTLLFWGTEVAKGNEHTHEDMPFLLAGGGGGFKMGRVKTFNSESHNNLLLAILHALGGTSSTSFGDPAFCTGLADMG